MFRFSFSGTINIIFGTLKISQNDPEILNLEFESHGFLENQVFLPTKQAGTNICWMIYQNTNCKICVSLFGWNFQLGRKTFCPNSTLSVGRFVLLQCTFYVTVKTHWPQSSELQKVKVYMDKWFKFYLLKKRKNEGTRQNQLNKACIW